MKFKKPEHYVQYRAVTWKRDRHGLFDNEAQNIEEVQHTINQLGTIYMCADEKIIFEASNHQVTKNVEPLAPIT